MNKTILMGRITKDLELKTTPSGVSVLSFSIAVDRKYKGPDGEKITDFHNIVVWRNTAEFVAKYFGKGRMICVIGELQNRSYEVNGEKRYTTEVVADEVYFTGEAKKEETPSNDTPSSAGMPDGFTHMPMPDDDDLPF